MIKKIRPEKSGSGKVQITKVRTPGGETNSVDGKKVNPPPKKS